MCICIHVTLCSRLLAGQVSSSHEESTPFSLTENIEIKHKLKNVTFHREKFILYVENLLKYSLMLPD